MQDNAIQDQYPEAFNHCFGCGQLNPMGHQLRTYLQGEETISKFTPEPHHTALPGYVYGGLIASLIDCHGTGTAAWQAAQSGQTQTPRFVTGTLNVTYHHPTPLGPELILKGRVIEHKGRKITVEVQLFAGERCCASGTVVAFGVSEDWNPE